MFAVGHMSLAYLLGKLSSKFLKVNPNIAVLMVLSILPDIDIAIETFTGLSIHRGPTHSLVVSLILFTPFFMFYGKRVVPYFLAFISHFLIGDFFIGGQLQLLWPLFKTSFGFFEAGFLYIHIYSVINLVAELFLFLIAVIIMAKMRDYRLFFAKNMTNLVLIIPITTVLLPTFVGYPFNEPLFLSSPIIGATHLFFLALFGLSILNVTHHMLTKRLGG
jgi:hypothetical protein